MSRTIGYSLWLMPSGEVYDKLNNLITELSRKYSAPNFEPHVTLIGKVIGTEEDILSKTLQLATVVKPYQIELLRVKYLNEYFRCLFLRANETDNVMRANLESRRIFSRQDDPGYMPHLSLMYGDFPSTTKEAIIRDIEKEFDLTFEVRSIHLFSTSGEPKDWYRIKRFPLK